MRIELPRLRTPVAGSTKEIGRAIAETLAANGAGPAIDVIGELRGTVPCGRLVLAPAHAAGEADILFNNVGT
jgi:NAD(P)-dependent dehydrogenase (short-subunit alcohol dehydrogenase family)